MRVEYAPRAIADAERIIAYYRKVADDQIADAFDKRLHAVVERIRGNPESMPRVATRPTVRVALLSHFPYKVFFRFSDGVATILHIRHTSRRPWRGS